MTPLTWRHHALIQALLSRGPLPESVFHKIFTEVTGKDPVVHHHHLFNDFLFKINKELAYVKFELRGCRNQYDGKVYYGVVNNVSDEHSKIGTKYSVPQVAYYKAVIEAIVQDIATQGCITNIEALNLKLENQVQIEHGCEESQTRIPAAFKSFSISQKEKTLNDLIRDQWLCSTEDGKIGLGVRSFLDLRSWFRTNEVPSCDVCNEAGVKAVTCPSEGCCVRIHGYCLKKKFSNIKVARVCPGCGTRWPFVEQYAEVEEDANDIDNTQTQRTMEGNVAVSEGNGAVSEGNGAKRNNRARRMKVEAAAANDDAQDPRPPRGRGKAPSSSRRHRICKAEAAEDVDDADGEEENLSFAAAAASNIPRRSQRPRRF